MAIFTFSGATGFNMSLWTAADILAILAGGNGVASAGATQMTYTYPVTPSDVLQATGTFSNFDVFGDPQQGLVTSFSYQVVRFGPPSTISGSGLSISVPTLFGWAATSNALALQSALFDGADTFTGSAFADVIQAYGGDDTINGGDGNDQLIAGAGNDVVNGGNGNDRIELGAGVDVLSGGPGDDVFVNDGGLLDTGADTIDGGDGTDTVAITLASGPAVSISTAGMNTPTGVTLSNGMVVRNIERVSVFTGAGNDTLTISLASGVALDAFRGGGGVDTLIADYSTGTTGYTLSPSAQFLIGNFSGVALESIEVYNVTTGSGADLLTGGDGADTFRSGDGADGLDGRGGADLLDGGAGDDSLSGGDGDDTLIGGAGADTLIGGAGANTMSGGDGDDLFYATAADTIDGGAGIDSVRLDLSAVTTNVTLTFNGSTFALTGASLSMTGIEVIRQLTTGSGNDVVSVAGVSDGTFSFDGGAGTDRFVIDLSQVLAGASFTPFNISLSGVLGVSINLSNFEEIWATGTSRDDFMQMGPGADRLFGGDGRDTLLGGGGADILDGGAGSDIIVVSSGATIDGGADIDQVIVNFSDATAPLTFVAAQYRGSTAVSLAGASVRNIEAFVITGGLANDTFVFDTVLGDNTVSGGAGVDSVTVDMSASTEAVRFSSGIIGGSGSRLQLDSIEAVNLTAGALDDFLLGMGNARNTIDAAGGADTIWGNNLADVLRGGAGNDQIQGFAGDDVLRGDGGSDALDGGEGRDTAVYNVSSVGATFVLNFFLGGPGGAWTVTAGADGADTVTNVEFLQFSDRTFALRPSEGALDGDAFSDILLRSSSGVLAGWLMNGTSLKSAAIIGVTDPVFSQSVTGDFDGDGGNDLILRAPNSLMQVWLLDPTGVAGVATFAPGASQAIVGVGDFNGDGKDDILFRDASGVMSQWRMNGLSATPGAFAVSDTSWSVAGVLDLDGDGKDDILWRNSSGLMASWLMDGFVVKTAAVFAVSDRTWSIVGVGDFNGDLRDDILWRSSGGVMAQWTMDGLSVTGAGTFAVSDTRWSVSDIGDYNGDGRDDILWQGPDGTFALWGLDGFSVAATGIIGNPGAGWTDII